MTFKEETYWAMLKDSISFTRQKHNIWASKGIIEEVIEELEKNEKQLGKAIQLQKDNDPGGLVDRKHLLMEEFTNKVYRLSCKLSLFARRTNNVMLLHSVDICESSFTKISHVNILKISSGIISSGFEYLSRVEKYGITTDELKGLKTELKEMQSLQTQVNLKMNERKSATREIKQLIGGARALLEELDDAFSGMIDDEDFLEAWFAIRKIKGRHYNKKSDHNESEAA